MASDKSVMAVIRAARPSFRNKNDKVAFAIHACFVASGYELIATGRPAFSADALSSSSSSTEEVGLDQWNELENEYAFVYANPENGSKKVLVKCLVINGTLSVDAVADGPSQNVYCELNVDDYVEETGGNNYSTHYKNLETLVKNVNTRVLSKLHGCSSPSSTSNPPRVGYQPVNDLYPGPGDRYPGGGNDLYPGAGTGMYPTRYPGSCNDLYPGPGAGMFPTRGGFDDGSMTKRIVDLVTLDSLGSLGFLEDYRVPAILGLVLKDHLVFLQVLALIHMGPPGIPDLDPDFARRPQGLGSRIHPDLEQPGSGSDYI
ncbi:hypothetical protein M0R45_029118 [Rubus argutus]|uniref:PI31 proteasome regulator N-terminal domain-containing protein n=1 Tax=Rubus argutus TaxID=59490 RepID=A0AAW1WB78_RUBAR